MRFIPHTWFKKPPLGTGIDYSYIPVPSTVFVLNENGGRDVSDPVGRNKGVIASNFTPSWISGNFGPALDTHLSLDVAPYFSVSSPNPTLTDIVLNSPAKATWLAWFKIRTGSVRGAIIMNKGDVATFGWWLGTTFSPPNYALYFEIDFDSFVATFARTTLGSLQSGVWNQVAVVLNGPTNLSSSLKLYINGVIATKASTGDGSGNQTTDSGQPFKVAGYLDGSLDHIAIWKGIALTSNQIQQLYFNPFAYWMHPLRLSFPTGMRGGLGHPKVGGKYNWNQLEALQVSERYQHKGLPPWIKPPRRVR